MKRLRDRVAVVTGAGSGIGRALVDVLAARGCALALADVDESGLAAAAAAGRAAGVTVSTHVIDVAVRDQVERLAREVVESHGAAHILINNAGVTAAGSIEEVPLDDIEWIVGVNLWGVIYGTKFFLPVLRAADEAHIVNISSLFGIIGVPGNGAYCTTKFGVRGFTETLRAELRGSPIGVTCVHPGGVRTNIVRNARRLEEAGSEEEAEEFDRVARMTPQTAATKIVGAIERDQARLRLGAETYLLDVIKRLFPVATIGLLGRVTARTRKRRAAR